MSDLQAFSFPYREDYSYAMRRFLADTTPSCMTKCFLKENYVEGEEEEKKRKTDGAQPSKKQVVIGKKKTKSFSVLDYEESDSDS